VQVIGASVDSAKANRAFAQRYDIAFPLLCDTDYAVSTAFGVARPPVGTARRATFVIDTDGTLLRVFANVHAGGHAAEVLAAVREIWREATGVTQE